MDNIIRNKFSVADNIQNTVLKDKIFLCWVKSMERGNWSQQEVGKIPFTLLIPNCPYSLLDHTAAVTKNALETARVLEGFHKDLKINLDFLITGGLLHDVGKLLEYSIHGKEIIKGAHGKLLRHPISGANLASEMGFPPEIVHIIATHSHEGDKVPRTTESIIIHHCDFIYFEVVKAQLNCM